MASQLRLTFGQKEASQHQEPVVLSQQPPWLLRDAQSGSDGATWLVKTGGNEPLPLEMPLWVVPAASSVGEKVERKGSRRCI